MPYAVRHSPNGPAAFPIRRVLDILLGKVRWFPGSGWCDQGLQNITLEPVGKPTVEQIRFVQRERPYLGNFLQVRRTLQEGGQFGFGDLLPTEAEQMKARLNALGLTYTVSRSNTWRPLNYDGQAENPAASHSA